MIKNGVNDFSQRNHAIDMLRAVTMLLMIFVNDLWTVSDVPAWLGHAALGEDMLGLADIVFPCFLFSVGMSIPFAIERRFSKGETGVSTVAHILSRTAALLIMGVFIVNTESGVSSSTGLSLPVYRLLMVTGFFLIWNVYRRTEKESVRNLYAGLKILGMVILLILAIIFRDNDEGVFSARWWGILGLIGWTYFLCAFIYLFSRDRLKYLFGAWFLFVLICILFSTTREGIAILNLPSGNFFNQILGILHIGNGALPAFTMGGMLLSVIGVKYAEKIKEKPSQWILGGIAVSLLFCIVGFVSHQYWIISKLSETPSWVFYCLAIGIGAYFFLYWLDKKDLTGWFKFIEPAGTATLTCYLIPYILYSIFALVNISLPQWAKVGTMGVLNSIVFSFLVIGCTYLLGKIHIKLKI